MSVKNLVKALKSLDQFTPGSVHKVVSECDVGFEDLNDWIDYDHPVIKILKSNVTF